MALFYLVLLDIFDEIFTSRYANLQILEMDTTTVFLHIKF
jgi:hypothetical protein